MIHRRSAPLIILIIIITYCVLIFYYFRRENNIIEPYSFPDGGVERLKTINAPATRRHHIYSHKPMPISRVNGMLKWKLRVMRNDVRPGNSLLKSPASVAKFEKDPEHSTPWGYVANRYDLSAGKSCVLTNDTGK